MNLYNQIELEAKRYNLIVDHVIGGVEIRTPMGWQFDAELHGLVSSQQDNEPMPNALRRALRDIREHGPRIQKCPDDCPCRE